MRTRTWIVAAAVLTGVLAAAPGAAAESAPDPCGDAVSADARRDLTGVAFTYSASSFQVRTTMCAPQSETSPAGGWTVIVHLPGISPRFQLIGVMTDLGRYAEWSGFYACDREPCPVTSEVRCGTSCGTTPGSTHPDGVRLENDHYWDSRDLPTLSGRTAFGYDSWAHVLPAGTSVPDTLEWWAEVRQPTSAGEQQVDRVPDSGTRSSARNRSPVATSLRAVPGPAPVWESYFRGPVRVDRGTLLTSDGSAVPNRYVHVTPAAPADFRRPTDPTGSWVAPYRVRANTAVRAAFPGDGVHEPAVSPPYNAYVRALVTLDEPGQLRLGTPVDLRGVVRPRGSGDVQVLVKPDAPRYAWSLLRHTSLVAGRTDSYYRVSWTPRARGRYVLFTRWRDGTTAQGGVLNGQSGYRFVTVS